VQGLGRAITRANRSPVSDDAFETFAKIDAIQDRMRVHQERYGLQRIIFIDWGKNMLPYWLAARACGIDVIAIADRNLASTGMKYRGVSIVDDRTASNFNFDAAIVSNLSPVHARRRREEWRKLTARPVIDLFASDNAALNRKRKDEQSALLPLAA
jgi:hypothetical protein